MIESIKYPFTVFPNKITLFHVLLMVQRIQSGSLSKFNKKKRQQSMTSKNTNFNGMYDT